jgi:hypothetical protein
LLGRSVRVRCVTNTETACTLRTKSAFHRTRGPHLIMLQLGYLAITVQEKLRGGWPGPFVKVEGVVISHSFAFSASRRLKFSYKGILLCTAFPSTLVSMMELSPPRPTLLLLRVGGLSRLNTRALRLLMQERCTNSLQIFYTNFLQ